MLRRLTSRVSQKSFLNEEIDELATEVITKRYIQGALGLSSVAMLGAALFIPNQPRVNRLIEMGFASALGFAGAAVSRMREDAETMYESNVELNRDVYRAEVKNRYAKEYMQDEVIRDASIVDSLYYQGIPISARAEYMSRYGIPQQLLMLNPDYQEAKQAQMMEQEAQMQAQSSGLSVNNINFMAGIAEPDKEIVNSIINPTVKGQLTMLKTEYPELFRLDNSWVVELAASSVAHGTDRSANHHFMITGATGAGKSILGGAIARMISLFTNNPTTIIGHDPKKDEGGEDITEWICKFTKDYKFDDYTSTERWCEALKSISTKQKSLFSNKANGAEDAGDLVIIQDELNTVYGNGKGFDLDGDEKGAAKLAAKLKAQWLYAITNMRAFKTHFIGLGQSPLSTDTGFSKPAMQNVCFIALGKTASYVMDSKNVRGFIYDLPDSKLEILRNAIEFLQDAKVRFALVVPTVGLPFIALVPRFDIPNLMNGDIDREITEYMQSQLETGEPTQTEIQDNDADSGFYSDGSMLPSSDIEDKQDDKTNDDLGVPTKSVEVEIDDNIQEVRKNVERTVRQRAFLRMKGWVEQCYEKYNRFPPREDIKAIWMAETGQTLTEDGITWLMGKLGITE